MVGILSHFNLQSFNTFGIKVFAKQFVDLKTDEEILNFVKSKVWANRPLLILGGGSNILFRSNFEGLVCKISNKGIEITAENNDEIFLKVAAGVVWDDFVEYCVAHNWGGVENLAAIPGNTGTSPIQNIGAYGVEVKDIIESVECISISTGEKTILKAIDCEFGYRTSIFKHSLKDNHIITHVNFKLSKTFRPVLSYKALHDYLLKNDNPNPAVREMSTAIREIRISKLPDHTQHGNAGSFFKNPTITETEFEKLKIRFPSIRSFPVEENMIKLAAGWLIEQCGLKGFSMGNAGVHDKQALVLVNRGNVTGEEIMQLSKFVIDSVYQKFSIVLEPEVNII